DGFTAPPRTGADIIQIDIDHDRAGRNFPGSLALVGDARTTLSSMVECAMGLTPRSTVTTEWIESQRRSWGEGLTSPELGAPMMDPRRVIETVQDVLGEAIVVAECGTPTPYVSAYWETSAAGRTIVVPRGHGPMGYAVAAGIGAAFAHPGRHIVV